MPEEFSKSTYAISAISLATNNKLDVPSYIIPSTPSILAQGVALTGAEFNVNLPGYITPSKGEGIGVAMEMFRKTSAMAALEVPDNGLGSFLKSSQMLTDYISPMNGIADGTINNLMNPRITQAGYENTSVNLAGGILKTMGDATGYINASALPLSYKHPLSDLMQRGMESNIKLSDQMGKINVFAESINILEDYDQTIGRLKLDGSTTATIFSSASELSAVLNPTASWAVDLQQKITEIVGHNGLLTSHQVNNPYNGMDNNIGSFAASQGNSIGSRYAESFSFNRINEYAPILYRESESTIKKRTEQIQKQVVGSIDAYMQGISATSNVTTSIDGINININLTVNIYASNIQAQNVQVGVTNKMITNGNDKH